MSNTASRPLAGLLWGLAGVACFSGTLTASRLASFELDPIFIGLGRALLPALLGGLLLWLTGSPRPTPGQWRRLALVAGGVVIGFPVFSTLAVAQVPASHAAVFGGLLPLATAAFATWRGGERPRPLFWLFALTGSALVVGYAWWQAEGGWQGADGWMLLAILLCGIGYAEGGRLARELGSWQTICWALLLAAPFLLLPVWWYRPAAITHWQTWAGFAYVSLISMFIGFFIWYRGLALGGVARVSQVQLLQPFGMMLTGMLVLGEQLNPGMLLVTAGVVVCVALGRKAV
ncbi:DMT family transporter [Pseudogulbenkiania sp. MAI-1]|uniref:DMT family transporter n=1 Tax=Pseudogulbenkiania sp. MAI-1 TaxID=990370 RepID=UPI00045E6523|nr:DMT family transporter [Pseudogulbenkiania sp. MAI-1]